MFIVFISTIVSLKDSLVITATSSDEDEIAAAQYSAW